jgi:hypothetical protein
VPQYRSDAFQRELEFLGAESSPAFVRAPEGNGWVASVEMVEIRSPRGRRRRWPSDADRQQDTSTGHRTRRRAS